MNKSDIGKTQKQKYLSKYRGTVMTNIDPLKMGRLLVKVPDVLGEDPCIWAASASPLTGKGMGVFWVPPIDSGVWVEFEGGDADNAIWTGCWRGTPIDMPALAAAAPPGDPPIVMGNMTQSNLVISNVPMAGLPAGGIMLRSGASFITIGPDGVQIFAPKIEINGMTIFNKGALTVTL